MSKTKQNLIWALRCSSSEGSRCTVECPYCDLQKVKDYIPIPADVVIGGEGYWMTCDTEQMAKDCIIVLEGGCLECEECKWGAKNPKECNNDFCELKEDKI